VNGAGQLVGGYRTVKGQDRAFLWNGSTFHDLGTLGGKQAVATATPQKDEAVGCAQTTTGAWHPFLYKHGAMKDLGLPSGLTQACAYSANRKGQIVGVDDIGPRWYSHPVNTRACKSWSRSASGKYTRIVTSPGATCVQARHVDSNGVVAVTELGPVNGSYTWKAGTGLTHIQPANVPFGDDLHDGFNCPKCAVVMDGVAGSNAHGQLLVLADDEPNDDFMGMLLTPLKIYDERSTALTYAGEWTRSASGGAWGGGVEVAGSAGGTVTFSFTGKSISVIAPTGPGLGSATVTVDGANPTTVEESTSSGQRRRVFQATFPTAGEHTLQIVAGSGFQVDAVTATQY
jgi:probable HAF family extracellular repeat protein